MIWQNHHLEIAGISLDSFTATESTTTGTSKGSTSGATPSKDYSTTNVQVENVDEADITKTDGDYIYSISEDKVVITDVRNTEELKIASKITMSNSAIPEDIILYNDKLVVIGGYQTSSSITPYYSSSSYYNKNGDTIVDVYDISNKDKPTRVKEYYINQDYYTSRCIGNKLYVISSGYLQEDSDNEIDISYKENKESREIGYGNIKYIPSIKTNSITSIALIDLDKIDTETKVNSYLIDVSNCYVSENNIYLINQNYEYAYHDDYKISDIFGFAGIFGLFDYNYDYNYDYGYYTNVYKFNIDGENINFVGNVKEKGKTLNQFSFDEYNGNLRTALTGDNGTKIVVFDKNMNKIGSVEGIEPNETMYSSRFIGDKAYLVTYRTIDPLFVVDLSDPVKPKVLGELKIPGYSTYLHPYDENHIIGIGMETKENINRDSNGKVISQTASIVGMKMALFDVSDVRNPIELSNVVIGDSRTTSAILTNHKALLFSKEKNLIAIPVNNYSEDFEVSTRDSDTISTMISSYTSYNKKYISEGYIVYDLNLEEGFKQKGIITHDLAQTNLKSYYRPLSNMLRGMYIEDNLYTISETAVKVNRLDSLELVNELKIINKGEV